MNRERLLPRPPRGEDQTGWDTRGPDRDGTGSCNAVPCYQHRGTPKSTMNTGGLYQRHMNEPILNSVIAGDIDSLQAQMEKPGGRIIMPKEKIAGVGPVVMIQAAEGKSIGLWKPEMK